MLSKEKGRTEENRKGREENKGGQERGGIKEYSRREIKKKKKE